MSTAVQMPAGTYPAGVVAALSRLARTGSARCHRCANPIDPVNGRVTVSDNHDRRDRRHVFSYAHRDCAPARYVTSNGKQAGQIINAADDPAAEWIGAALIAGTGEPMVLITPDVSRSAWHEPETGAWTPAITSALTEDGWRPVVSAPRQVTGWANVADGQVTVVTTAGHMALPASTDWISAVAGAGNVAVIIAADWPVTDATNPDRVEEMLLSAGTVAGRVRLVTDREKVGVTR